MEKRIGLLEAISIGIGGMVGGGIFSVLGVAAHYAGHLTPIAFLIAGAVALLTAYSYAKFSSRIHSEGGTVEYIAYSFRNGLIVGAVNLLLLIGYTIMLSLYARTFGYYLSAMLSNAVPPLFLSISVLFLFALMNVGSVERVGKVEDMIVGLKVAILLLFSIAGLLVVGAKPITFDRSPLEVIAGSFLIFLAYEGFELISNAARDVKDPVTTLPRALYLSVIAVTVIYFLVALVSVSSLSPEEISRYRDYALAVAAEPFLGKLGFVLISIAAVLSTASAINATLYGSARMAYVLAKEGVIPVPEVHKWGSIAEGLLIVLFLSLMALIFLDLEGISLLGSATFLLVFTLVNLGALVRRKEIGANPLLTALAFSGSGAALAVLLLEVGRKNPGELVTFLLAVLFSFLLEIVFRKVKRRRVNLRFWKG